MPDDTRSDEQLIEAAHKALERLLSRSVEQIDGPALDAAITALGKRLIQRTEAMQAAEDALEHVRGLVLTVETHVLEIDSFLRHRGRP